MLSLSALLQHIKHLDNRLARWMLNNFYFAFFQCVLVVIFFLYFFNILQTLNMGASVSDRSLQEELLLQLNIQTGILTFLIFLNSFWMLFIFNHLNRIRLCLRDINFQIRHRHPKK